MKEKNTPSLDVTQRTGKVAGSKALGHKPINHCSGYFLPHLKIEEVSHVCCLSSCSLLYVCGGNAQSTSVIVFWGVFLFFWVFFSNLRRVGISLFTLNHYLTLILEQSSSIKVG